MLLEFKVKNYLSFKEEAEFSMIGADLKHLTQNVHQKDAGKVLKSAVIYGANASGKSNLLRAITFYVSFIKFSWKSMDREDKISRIPFKLDKENLSNPTEMSCTFLIGDDVYQHSIVFDEFKVYEEVLEFVSDDALIYKRNGREIVEYNQKFISKKVKELLQISLRENSVALSAWNAIGENKDDLAKKIMDYFNKYLSINIRGDFFYSKQRRKNAKEYSTNLIRRKEEENDTVFLEKLKAILRIADLGIEDITTEKELFEYDKDLYVEDVKVKTIHKVSNFNKDVLYETFYADDFESNGTLALLCIAPILIDALDRGLIVLYDELDSTLHPLLVKMIITFFNDKEINASTQLITTVHDISLIDNYANLFRRDQIWFCEKLNNMGSKIYSLYDFDDSSIRNDENYAKNYIRGKYKAVPLIRCIDDFKSFVLNTQKEKQK